MNASQGREPARPQQGTGAGGAKNTSAAAQPRLSREAVVAFVLLPVLLAAGFFLGGRLLGEDSPGTLDAADVDATQGTDDGAAPGPETGVDPSASPTDVPPVVGPPAPSDAAAPESTEAPAQAPSPEPTEAPTQAPSPEPTQEPTEAPTQAPSPEPTQEPAATQPPAPEPTEAPAPAPTQPADPAQELPSDPGLLTTIPADVPQPTAGNAVLLFPGFSSDDVRTWQARMVERGWDLTVDGIYGERTAQVAQSFQIEKGLVVDGLVGPETWTAAWTAPIT